MAKRSQDTIPTAPDAEKAVIGVIMLDQKFPEDCALDKSLFYGQSNREIFEAMQAIAKEPDGVIDPVQIMHKLREAGRLDAVGPTYINSLYEYSIRSNFPAALKLLIETAAKREIWFAANAAVDDSLNGKAPGEIAEALRSALDRLSTNTAGAKKWPEPLPLPGGRLSAPPLRSAMLPPALAAWLADISRRLQVPLDFAAIPAIVSLATVIGSKVRIRPKQKDDWTVVPNLWGAIIGDPGVLKSPTIEQATRPLRRLIAQAEEKYQADLKRHVAEAEADEDRRKAIQKQIKAALSAGEDTTMLRAQMGEQPRPPTEQRYMVNDATVEKLGELLAQNRNGLLLFRDELTGWLKTLDKPTNANERAFYLESWDGGQPYIYDRIGRGTTRIPNATMSVIGGIQPGPLADYLTAANANSVGADGLMQRFQLAVWPDEPGEYVHVDEWPDNDAKNQAFRIFELLDTIEPTTERFNHVETGYAYLRFDRIAQAMFDEWYTEIQNRVRAEHSDPAFRSHMAKFGSLFASLALIFHLCDVGDAIEIPNVSTQAAKLAVYWCDYLEGHARKIYGLQVAEAGEAVKRLAARLRANEIESGFQPRHIQRKNWAGLNTAEDIGGALAVLCDLRWIEREEIESLIRGSKPRVRYLINPRITEING